MDRDEQKASESPMVHYGEASTASTVNEPTLEQVCNYMRAEALKIEQMTRQVVMAKVGGEAAAQAMLAVRHLEDARMRLGKVIQHTAGGGVSCWDSDRKPSDDGR